MPFLIAMPGWGGARDSADSAVVGRRVDRVGSLIDIAPTILDVLGLAQPSLQQGVSMLDPTPRMALFYTDYSLGWLGLADGCWKYLFQVESGRSSLFDVCTDPGETVDRAMEHGDRIEAYRTRLRKWAVAERAAMVPGEVSR